MTASSAPTPNPDPAAGALKEVRKGGVATNQVQVGAVVTGTLSQPKLSIAQPGANQSVPPPASPQGPASPSTSDSAS